MDTRELETYLNEKSAEAEDLVEIMEEGSFEDLERDGKKHKVLNIPVKIENRELLYTPGKIARNILQDAFGFDTKDWVGKKFNVAFVEMQIGKEIRKVIKPIPIKTEKA